MEEKKLIDEEIVKALEHCSHNRSCEYCYHNDERGSGEIVCRSRLMGKSLDLIHRLQDENKQLKCDSYRTSWKAKFLEAKKEIERLTERETFLENAWKTSLESTQTVEIALKANRAREKELQKQVDELKEKRVIECHGMLKGCDMVKQAVKDTAKEILIPLVETEKQIDPLKTGIRWSVLKGFCKRYGVEVE